MRFSSRFIFVLSVISAVIALTVIVHLFNEMKKDPRSILAVTAMRNLDVGDELKKSDISLLLAPKGADLNTLLTDLDSAAGRNLRNAVRRGQLIKTFDFADETDNITSLIPEGYRAATCVLVLPEETVRLLKFGRRVDVLFTDTTAREFNTKTIMKNVLVMKVDSSSKNKSKTPANEDNAKVDVTLAVKPEGAEVIAYAIKKGKLDLSIRPMAEQDVKESYLTLEDIMGIKAPVLQLGNQTEIEVFRGVKKEKVRL
jgi:Flp pilus assembly protein CpaB